MVGSNAALVPVTSFWSSSRRKPTASFVATRALLKKLGFRYEDGSFMRVDTRRGLAERLSDKFGLGKRQAVKTVSVAEAMRWVSFPD